MEATCACCCCQGEESSHSMHTVSLDQIVYEDEQRMKKGLEQNYGICSVRFDYFTGRLLIEYNSGHIGPEEINLALQAPGFVLETNIKQWLGVLLEKHGERLRLVISGVFLLASWTVFFIQGWDYKFPSISYILLNLLTISIAGMPTLKGLKAAIRDRKLNVSVLIGIAVVSAIALLNWLEAATVLFITVVGEAMERGALDRSRNEVVVATIVGAKHALVKEENGRIVEVPVHKVVRGQRLVVLQGESIPVDGIVVAGGAQVNQSALTGESELVSKSVNDKVYAGTLLEQGKLEMDAVTVGGETAVARIARMVEQARQQRTDWEKTVDRFARYFVPVIIVVGIGVFATNLLLFSTDLVEAMERAVTVWVVACPCALVLATPTAISAGVGKAAKLGVLFKNGNIIERLAKLSVLLMDKTGTLTYGRPKVIAVKAFEGNTEADVVSAAVIVERQSQHPLAKAVCAYARSQTTSPGEADRFMEFEGGGACAKVGDRLIKVGAQWLMEDGRDIPDEVSRWIDASQNEGYTPILVADDHAVLGGFRIADEVREDSRDVLDSLRKKGVDRIVMVTGDKAAVAERVAKSLDVDDCFPECMPDTKLKKLAEVKGPNVVVGMVGDGINDAPALAAADVGIAMGAIGSDAAVAASDVSLMTKTLGGLAESFVLSKMVLSTIRWNIFFAVTVNLLMVVLATYGHVNMILGAFFHQVSALVVILNSYLLFFRKVRIK